MQENKEHITTIRSEAERVMNRTLLALLIPCVSSLSVSRLDLQGTKVNEDTCIS